MVNPNMNPESVVRLLYLHEAEKVTTQIAALVDQYGMLLDQWKRDTPRSVGSTPSAQVRVAALGGHLSQVRRELQRLRQAQHELARSAREVHGDLII